MLNARFHQKTIALIYDFDNTLTPLAMQEYTVLPELGVRPRRFWARVAEETRRLNADQMLTWMRLLLTCIEESKRHLSRNDLKRLAKNIQYYPGVSTWFSRINSHISRNAPRYVQVEHYLISAGLKEILDGVTIKRHFRQIYASEYHYDHHGVADFPAVLVNDTMKTQFLFRINKGKELLNQTINEHMPEAERPIPFKNMIYIGDGMSDVPSMTVTKKNGGHSIAVHKPSDSKSIAVCKQLLSAGRVDYYTSADFRSGSALCRYVTGLLNMLVARIQHEHSVARAKQRALK